MGKKFFILTALFFNVLALSGKNGTAGEMNSILASVNGEVISLKDVLLLTRNQEYLAYAAFSGEKLTAEIRKIRKKAVDEIIDRKLLVGAYYKQSFRISSRDIENEIDRTAQRMGCRSRDEFRSKMLAEQVDFESFRKELTERMIHVCMIQRLAMIEGAPTPKEVYEYFQKHRKSLAVSESYELAMLKLDSSRSDFQAEIKEVTAILSQFPERFSELVRKFDPRNKDGRIGSIEPGKMRSEFALAIKVPVEGKVYGPIQLDDGTVWVKMLRHNKGSDAEFSKVQEKIITIIETEKQRKALAVYMAELRKNAVLEYFF